MKCTYRVYIQKLISYSSLLLCWLLDYRLSFCSLLLYRFLRLCRSGLLLLNRFTTINYLFFLFNWGLLIFDFFFVFFNWCFFSFALFLLFFNCSILNFDFGFFLLDFSGSWYYFCLLFFLFSHSWSGCIFSFLLSFCRCWCVSSLLLPCNNFRPGLFFCGSKPFGSCSIFPSTSL